MIEEVAECAVIGVNWCHNNHKILILTKNGQNWQHHAHQFFSTKKTDGASFDYFGY